jgi:hypothetical protein
MRNQSDAGNGVKSLSELQQMHEVLISSLPANPDKDEAIEFVKNSLDLLKNLPATEEVKNAISVLPKNPDSLRNAKKEDAVNTANLALSLVRSLAVISGSFQALGTPSTNLVSELNNIDFSKLIGGPLQAAVRAQGDSAMTTVNFIKEVGFKPSAANDGTLDVVYVDFYYEKDEAEKDADGKPKVDSNGNPVMTKSKKLIKVPLISMLPIPSLRIEEMNIDFNVKLNSLETNTTSSQLNIGAEVAGKFPSVNFKVTASYQRNSTSGVEVKKEYTMGVKVRATQDELPAGLEKILNLLSA